MAILEWNKDETVAIMTLTNGENRFNPDFNAAMLHVFGEIEADPSISSVVINSNDTKNWSQGIDLMWMMDKVAKKDLAAVRAFIYAANDVFRRILLFPHAGDRGDQRPCLRRREHYGLRLRFPFHEGG